MKLRITDGTDAAEFEARSARDLADVLEDALIDLEAKRPALQVHVRGDWISPRYPRGNGPYRINGTENVPALWERCRSAWRAGQRLQQALEKAKTFGREQVRTDPPQ